MGSMQEPGLTPTRETPIISRVLEASRFNLPARVNSGPSERVLRREHGSAVTRDPPRP
jgi:hypothetical protein